MKKKISFQAKLLSPLIIAVMILFLGALLSTWFHVYVEEKNRIEKTAQNFFVAFQEMISDDLKHHRISKVQLAVDRLIKTKHESDYFSSVSVIKPDGTVLVSSPEVIRQTSLDEISAQVLKTGMIQKKIDKHELHIASPLFFGSSDASPVFAVIKGVYSLEAFSKQQLIFQIFLVLTLVALFFVILNWAVRFSQNISNPLVSLTEKLKSYIDDEKAKELASHSGDIKEISELTEVYNSIIRQREDLKNQVVLKTRLEALGLMARTYGHVMRNALNNVLSAVSAMAVTKNDIEKENLKTQVEDEISRINRFSMTLSKSTKLRKVDKEWIDLNSLLDKVSSSLHHSISKNNIKITKSFAEKAPLYADQDMIHTAIENLLINAIEAIKTDGVIHITTHNHKENGSLQFSIRDSGCGIPEEDLSRLFDPFFSTKNRGSGMGLSHVKEILDTHNATIVAESIANKGATFIVTFRGENKENERAS